MSEVNLKELLENVSTDDIKKELKRRENVEIKKKVKEFEKELKRKLKGS